MNKLSQIESIAVKFIELLQQVGIDDQQQLLEICKKRNGRYGLSQQTGINLKLLNRWIAHADLARINGIGQEYAELLEYCGINSIKALARCTPTKLLIYLQQINALTHLVKQLPNKKQIEYWQEQAKKLPSQFDE